MSLQKMEQPQFLDHIYLGYSWVFTSRFSSVCSYSKLIFMALIGIWTPLIRLTVEIKERPRES